MKSKKAYKQIERAKKALEQALDVLREGTVRVHPFEDRVKHEIANLDYLLTTYQEYY